MDADVVGAPVAWLDAVVGRRLERRSGAGCGVGQGGGDIAGVALDAGPHDDEVGDDVVRPVAGDFDVVGHGGNSRSRATPRFAHGRTRSSRGPM